MKSFYITTAIDYVNGSPHLGHAYEKVLTDVIARFRRQMGDQVHFLTGTDEHGQKVQSSARKLGVAPLEFADKISADFRELLKRLNISNDDFIRTTEDRHKTVAFARHVAMYLCKQRLKCSFPERGRAFGGRDHTTVMSAVRKIEAQREADPHVRAHLDARERKLAEGS